VVEIACSDASTVTNHGDEALAPVAATAMTMAMATMMATMTAMAMAMMTVMTMMATTTMVREVCWHHRR